MTEISIRNPITPVRGKWFFLGAYIFACFVLWWLSSILLRTVAHQQDPVQNETIWISISATLCFIVGYLFPAARPAPRQDSEPVLDACAAFAYKVTLLLFVPAMVLAVLFYRTHAGVDYGRADLISMQDQALFYTHLFFGFMFIGAVEPKKEGWNRILIVVALTTLPRLIISLHWGRFFLAQAIVPVLFIAFARGWIRLSLIRIFQLAALALVIYFVPAITRGDDVMRSNTVISFITSGSSLKIFQENENVSLEGRCPPIIVSFTKKTIPYRLLGVCLIDIGTLHNIPADIGRIIIFNDPATVGLNFGGGSDYLLELYVTAGIPAILVGSALFGLSCMRFLMWIGRRSLYAGIWAECLTRALFAPRSELGYVYERIPSLVLATLAVVFVVGATKLLLKTHRFPPPKKTGQADLAAG